MIVPNRHSYNFLNNAISINFKHKENLAILPRNTLYFNINRTVSNKLVIINIFLFHNNDKFWLTATAKCYHYDVFAKIYDFMRAVVAKNINDD